MVPRYTHERTILAIAFTATLVGYLMVWLPQPVVGLSFIGLEMGEWAKFVPQVQSGEYMADRQFFFLPPIALGLMLSVWSWGWRDQGWRSWIIRLTGLMVSLLAIPPLEVLRGESAAIWWLRVALIGLVAATAALSDPLSRALGSSLGRNRYLILTLLALIAALLPTWAYLALRGFAVQLFGGPVGIGPGVWLNLAGNLAVAAVGLLRVQQVLRRRY